MTKLTREQIENIAVARGYKLPHVTVNQAIAGDLSVLLTCEEFKIVASERGGLGIMDYLKLTIEEKENIKNKKTIELLTK